MYRVLRSIAYPSGPERSAVMIGVYLMTRATILISTIVGERGTREIVDAIVPGDHLGSEDFLAALGKDASVNLCAQPRKLYLCTTNVKTK